MSIDWKTYQVICSSPEFSLVLEITFGQEEKWDPLQCDQVFSGAITTSGCIKLLHWAKNYHGTIFSPKMVASGGCQKIFPGKFLLKHGQNPFFLNQICKI